jgi:hypothetical protein
VVLNANLGFHLYAPTTIETLTPVIYSERASIVTTEAGLRHDSDRRRRRRSRVEEPRRRRRLHAVLGDDDRNRRRPGPASDSVQPAAVRDAPVELTHEEWAIHMLGVSVRR